MQGEEELSIDDLASNLSTYKDQLRQVPYLIWSLLSNFFLGSLARSCSISYRTRAVLDWLVDVDFVSIVTCNFLIDTVFLARSVEFVFPFPIYLNFYGVHQRRIRVFCGLGLILVYDGNINCFRVFLWWNEVLGLFKSILESVIFCMLCMSVVSV